MSCRVLILVTLTAACSAEMSSESVRDRAAERGESVAGSGPESSRMQAEQACDRGQQSCYCPDGTRTGLQLCGADGQLQPCNCYSEAAASSDTSEQQSESAPTGADEVMQVCAELQDMPGCDARSYESDELPSSLLFVLDRSGSMACNPPPIQSVEECNMMPGAKDPAQPSRWDITVEALKETFASLEGANAAAGLELFSVDNACGVHSTPNVTVSPISKPQLDTLASALDAFDPRGGTPLVGATVLAYAHLHQEIMAEGNRYVVLITDGEESCGFGGDSGDEADLADARRHLLEVEVMKAREANIRTFVIGAPGSEGARGFLSELAHRGGTARRPDCVHDDPDSAVGDCHYDLTAEDDFAAVLRDALGEISGQALGCEFATPDGRSSRINVQYRGGGDAPTCLAFDDRACDGGADGWQFAKTADGEDDLSRVVLCGPACERIKEDPTVAVDVILGCQVLE